ncbi:MAG TPA: hypothetical protein VIH04_08405 [Nitrosarchaeum sp.]
MTVFALYVKQRSVYLHNLVQYTNILQRGPAHYIEFCSVSFHAKHTRRSKKDTILEAVSDRYSRVIIEATLGMTRQQ